MSMDTAAATIINIIRSIVDAPKQNTMIYGKVKTVGPISVEIADGVVLNEKQLFLGQMVRPHKVKIPHTHILDTHFTEKSPSVGSIGAGMVAGMAFEQAQAAAANAKMNTYTELNDDDGSEITKTISDADLGRSSISTSIVVAGLASVTDTSVMITDKMHKHIIDRQITKDVHFPKSDYEECVVLEIEPKLAEGDTVLMFAMNNYQTYYIAERIEKEEGE